MDDAAFRSQWLQKEEIMVYRIIPKQEVIIEAETKEKAMEKYLSLKDTEVTGLFQAVPEEEWREIKSKNFG